jgi:hypothetical protein
MKREGMKRTVLLTLCLIIVVPKLIKAQNPDAPRKGYYKVFPYAGDPDGAVKKSRKGDTIPLSNFTFTASKDNHTYRDVIVGQSPFDDKLNPTSVKVLVVPMIINIGNSVFDSTLANTCGGSMGNSDLDNFLNSPIITPVTFDGQTGPGHAALVNGVNMGTQTFNDTHRRAEFLGAIGGAKSPYRTHYAVSVAPTQTIPTSVTNGHSTVLGGSGCHLLGGLDLFFIDGYFTNTVLPAVGGDPHQFVIFLMRDVVLYEGNPGACCVLGYHGTLSNLQTYSPVDYDTTGDFGPGVANVSIAAHEVGEWLDDPLGSNPTPSWGGIGQVGGCQGNWEVGDPLTGTDFPPITMANGVTYNPQETVFWSWFYSADHDSFFQNITAGGKYSMNGSFGGPSKVCPPGGTFAN